MIYLNKEFNLRNKNMDKIHKHLEQRLPWYARFHSRPGHVVFNWVIFFVIASVLTTVIILRVNDQANPVASQASNETSEVFRMVNAAVADASTPPLPMNYAYAPSIIKLGSTYHGWFCSAGEPDSGWDHVRYITSRDGQSWSRPVVALKSRRDTNSTRDLAACDPSVVYFKAPTDIRSYYYMYYSSAIQSADGLYATVIQVARSSQVNGPFEYYTQNGTWSANPQPTNPSKILVQPFNLGTTGYGAGQQIVIAKDGKLMMWYTDDTRTDNPGHIARLYYMESTDGLTWNKANAVQVDIADWSNSNDIKYDQAANRFVMYRVQDSHTQNSALQIAYSTDGLHWGGFQTIVPKEQFPNFAHNSGFAGTQTGYMLPGNQLVSFGAPRNINATTDTFGSWDLYGLFINATVQTDTAAPAISEVRATRFEGLGAANTWDITWTTNEFSTSQVAYGLTTNYNQLSNFDSNLVTGHSVRLTGLANNQTYHFKVTSRDAAGNTANSIDYTFSTATNTTTGDTTAPQITQVTSRNGSGGTVISWRTNEASDSVVQFVIADSKGSFETKSNEQLTTNHSIVLTGLTANTTYTYRVQSKDAAGNTATSDTKTFLSSKVVPVVDVK